MMDIRQQRKKKVSTDEWYTPQWIIEALGPFDLDPCSPKERPFDTAKVHLTKEQDGLTMPWGTSETVRVWLNPPYSRVLLEQFIKKMAQHNNGIALLVNRQDNVMWQEVIFPTAASMLFMRHRVKFIHPEGKKSSPFTGSCLVAWRKYNDEVLRSCHIEGKYVRLNEV
jgi:phage N-6-adenine-methyltransferase